MLGLLFAITMLGAAPAEGVAPQPMVSPAPAVLEADGMEWVFEWAGRGMPERFVHTDTTVLVDRGMTLVLEGLNGDIRVATWAEPRMRVRAEHRKGDRITVHRRGRQLQLEAVRPLGIAEDTDWSLTVPGWLPLRITSLGGEVSVEGTQAALEVTALAGDVRVKDSRGPLTLNSVEGRVIVLDTQGRVTASSVNNDVRLERVIGRIDAQSVNGSIRLEQLRALEVAASSVNGRVWFTGPFLPRGRYALTSHNGELVLGVPEGQDARVRVNTYQGEVRSEIPGWNVPPEPHARSFHFTMGEGGPEVDLESFNGLIQLMKLGDVEAKLRRIDDRVRERAVRREVIRAPRAPKPPKPPEREADREAPEADR